MSSFNETNNKGERKMAVLTAKCNKAFVVSPEKSKEFIEHKCIKNTDKEILLKITSKIKRI